MQDDGESSSVTVTLPHSQEEQSARPAKRSITITTHDPKGAQATDQPRPEKSVFQRLGNTFKKLKTSATSGQMFRGQSTSARTASVTAYSAWNGFADGKPRSHQ